MEPEGSQTRLQVPAACSYPENIQPPRLCRDFVVAPRNFIDVNRVACSNANFIVIANNKVQPTLPQNIFKIISHIPNIIIPHKNINLIKNMNGTLLFYFLKLIRGNLFATRHLQGLEAIFDLSEFLALTINS